MFSKKLGYRTDANVNLRKQMKTKNLEKQGIPKKLR